MEFQQIKKAAEFLETKRKGKEKVAVVLGSGLSGFSDKLEGGVHVSFKEVPGMPVSTAPTHKGEFLFGRLGEEDIICINGRVHYYEGYDLTEITMYVRILKLLGIEKIIFTNATGSLRKDYEPGDMILITDHINMTGLNPLRGANMEEFGPRFADMTDEYSLALRALAKQSAQSEEITLKEGIYAYSTGPSFETAAEVKAYGLLGADIVGMSTIPEVIVARHSGMEILGLSCVTNFGTGISSTPLSLEDVTETSKKAGKTFVRLLSRIVQDMHKN